MLFLFSFGLLVTNEVFNHGGFGNMLSTLMIVQLLLLLFLLFGIAYILLNFLAMSSLIVQNFLSLFFLLFLAMCHIYSSRMYMSVLPNPSITLCIEFIYQAVLSILPSVSALFRVVPFCDRISIWS